VEIKSNNQVWSSDITYLPLYKSYVYLVAVIDWFSKYVLSWELSNSMDVYFCLEALDKALRQGKPKIFNTDQGSRFTSKIFTQTVTSNEIEMSMDSKGRALDNIFIERLWRSLKYEDIYLKDYRTFSELRVGLKNYFDFYNNKRVHQSLNYKTPAEIQLTHFVNKSTLINFAATNYDITWRKSIFTSRKSLPRIISYCISKNLLLILIRRECWKSVVPNWSFIFQYKK
jgi:hypothetical protein